MTSLKHTLAAGGSLLILVGAAPSAVPREPARARREHVGRFGPVIGPPPKIFVPSPSSIAENLASRYTTRANIITRTRLSEVDPLVRTTWLPAYSQDIRAATTFRSGPELPPALANQTPSARIKGSLDASGRWLEENAGEILDKLHEASDLVDLLDGEDQSNDTYCSIAKNWTRIATATPRQQVGGGSGPVGRADATRLARDAQWWAVRQMFRKGVTGDQARQASALAVKTAGLAQRLDNTIRNTSPRAVGKEQIGRLFDRVCTVTGTWG